MIVIQPSNSIFYKKKIDLHKVADARFKMTDQNGWYLKCFIFRIDRGFLKVTDETEVTF